MRRLCDVNTFTLLQMAMLCRESRFYTALIMYVVTLSDLINFPDFFAPELNQGTIEGADDDAFSFGIVVLRENIVDYSTGEMFLIHGCY